MLNNNGITTLMEAARDGDEQAVMQCLERGDNVNEFDYNGATALIWAALKGKLKIVEKLLEKGANINQASNSGMTALMHAAHQGHVNVVVELLKWSDVNQTDKEGNTPLMWAVIGKKIKTMAKLLEAGADINYVDYSGNTVLMKAARNGYKAILKKLLEEGSSTNLFVGNLNNIPADCAFLINIAQITWKQAINQDLSDEENIFLNIHGNNSNFAKKFLKGKVIQIIWKEAIGKELSFDESLFLGMQRDNQQHTKFAREVIQGRSAQIAWKSVTKSKLSDEELRFLESNSYNKDFAIEYLKNTAIKITEKVIKKAVIDDEETIFLNSDIFDEYDFTLSKFFYENGDLISSSISNKLSKDVMEIIIKFLPKEEVFVLQEDLVNYTKIETNALHSISAVEESKESRNIELQSKSQNQENDSVVHALHDLKYDNELLNHPEIALRAIKLGIDSFNLLLKVAENSLDQTIILLTKLEEDEEKLYLERGKEYKIMQIASNSKFVEPNNDVENFFAAIDQNNLDKIQELFLMHPQLAQSINSEGNSALFMAIIFGHKQIANYLLDQGAYAPEYDLQEEMFDLNLLRSDNLDQEKAEVQWEWSFMREEEQENSQSNWSIAPEDNMLSVPLLGLLLTCVMADYKIL